MIYQKKKQEIYDLENIPQDIKEFTKWLDNNVSLYDVQKQYEKHYFRAWNFKKPSESIENIKWPFKSYKVGSSYGENLQLLDKDFFQNMHENANFKNYLSVNKKALTLACETNMYTII